MEAPVYARNPSAWDRPCGGRSTGRANSSSECSASASRSSEMAEAAIKRTPGRGRFITFEGGEGIRQIHADQDACRSPEGRPRYPPSSPASPAGRRAPRSSATSCCPAWANCSARRPRPCCSPFCARRPRAHGDPARPSARDYGCCATGFRIRRAPIRASLGKVSPAVLNALERVTIGDLKPDSDHHSRCPGRSRHETRRPPAVAPGRPTGSRRKTSSFTRDCARRTGRSPPATRSAAC